jgi:hypothetical protein
MYATMDNLREIRPSRLIVGQRKPKQDVLQVSLMRRVITDH